MSKKIRFSANVSACLTPENHEKITKTGTRTTIEILSQDPEALAQSTGVSYRVIENIRTDIYSASTVLEYDGLSFFKETLQQTSLFSTGYKQMDKLLDGGLMTEEIVEIYGKSCAGKTRLLVSICLHVTMKFKKHVVFLDPTGSISRDFLIERCEKLFGDKMKESFLKYLLILCPKNVWEMLNILEKLCLDEEFLYSDNKSILGNIPVSLVAVDALSSYFSPFTGDSHIQALGLMNHTAKILQNLMRKRKASILVGNNSVAQKSRGDEEEVEIKQAMGSYWSHVPNTRILIEQDTSEAEVTHKLKVIKSTRVRNNEERIKI